jgi:hypothetical protein
MVGYMIFQLRGGLADQITEDDVSVSVCSAYVSLDASLYLRWFDSPKGGRIPLNRLNMRS